MVDEQKPKTEAELKAELDKAYKSGDWKAISKVAGEIAKFEKDKEAEARAKLEKELETLTAEIKTAIDKAVQPFIDSKKLDSADGIWYDRDFGDKLTSCRVTKKAVRKSSGGGGGGKKFDVSTEDLLKKYGDKEYKDGKTYQAVHDGSTDRNVRYQVRLALLKLDGQR